jgi:hypothetical protein
LYGKSRTAESAAGRDWVATARAFEVTSARNQQKGTVRAPEPPKNVKTRSDSGSRVKIAVGRDYADVPPVTGNYKGATERKMEVEVSIKEAV